MTPPPTDRLLAINAFDMCCPGHIQQGLWCHPRDHAVHYRRLAYWADYARRLERGLFDGLFLADVLGIYDVYAGSPEAALRHAVQVPVHDPLMVIGAMALVTQHLGFGVTANLSYESPYLFARRMSTLDHLTDGRLAWNIVTGYLDSAARAQGRGRQTMHDDRYDLADEFMQLVYQLWEHSWSDDAVVGDRSAAVYTLPDRVRPIHHRGRQFALDAVHLCEPSPQRTPLLFQAGASARGQRFAGEHAECVFLNGQSPQELARLARQLRAQCVQSGRQAQDLRIFAGMTVVTGKTQAEAQERLEDYRRYVNTEAALVHASASLGIDLSGLDLDEPVEASPRPHPGAPASAEESTSHGASGRAEQLRKGRQGGEGKTASLDNLGSQAIQSNLEIMRNQHGARWTKGDLIRQMVLGSRQVPLVADAQSVADYLVHVHRTCDIDGINLSRTVVPECFDDFIDLVIPELQSRGVFKTHYTEGTFRRKLFGHDRLRAPHPATRPPLQAPGESIPQDSGRTA